MGPSKTSAKIPDLNQRDVQRQTIPVDGDDDQDQRQRQHQHQHQHTYDSPPPYEPSSAAGSTSASAIPAALFTPPTSFPPTAHESVEESRSSCSSFGEDDTIGLLAGKGRRSGEEEGYNLTPRPAMPTRGDGDGEGGYARTEPMSVDGDDKWDKMADDPGCCFSESAGCCFSKRAGCCFSDRGGCCFSDRDGCCCSDTGGCCFSSNSAGCCSGTTSARGL